MTDMSRMTLEELIMTDCGDLMLSRPLSCMPDSCLSQLSKTDLEALCAQLFSPLLCGSLRSLFGKDLIVRLNTQILAVIPDLFSYMSAVLFFFCAYGSGRIELRRRHVAVQPLPGGEGCSFARKNARPFFRYLTECALILCCHTEYESCSSIVPDEVAAAFSLLMWSGYFSFMRGSDGRNGEAPAFGHYYPLTQACTAAAKHYGSCPLSQFVNSADFYAPELNLCAADIEMRRGEREGGCRAFYLEGDRLVSVDIEHGSDPLFTSPFMTSLPFYQTSKEAIHRSGRTCISEGAVGCAELSGFCRRIFDAPALSSLDAFYDLYFSVQAGCPHSEILAVCNDCLSEAGLETDGAMQRELLACITVFEEYTHIWALHDLTPKALKKLLSGTQPLYPVSPGAACPCGSGKKESSHG